MKLYDRFEEFCYRIDEEKLWGRFFFYLTSVIWLIYLKTFIHELGHAVAAIALGGTVTGFEMKWSGGGSINWLPPVDTIHYDYIVLNTLVLVSGGIAAMLLFMALSHKTKWFLIPAVLALLNGFLEALHMNELRVPLTDIIGLAGMWAIITLIHGLAKSEDIQEIIE